MSEKPKISEKVQKRFLQYKSPCW